MTETTDLTAKLKEDTSKIEEETRRIKEDIYRVKEETRKIEEETIRLQKSTQVTWGIAAIISGASSSLFYTLAVYHLSNENGRDATINAVVGTCCTAFITIPAIVNYIKS